MLCLLGLAGVMKGDWALWVSVVAVAGVGWVMIWYFILMALMC